MDSFLKIIEIHKSKSALVAALKKLRPLSKVQVAHISNWINRDGKIPSEWVIACCNSVHWKVTPHELRPDIYPHPHDGLPDNLRKAA
jgi:DNA-binding transcriptional regulator YdaS (Cro superfamily)